MFYFQTNFRFFLFPLKQNETKTNNETHTNTHTHYLPEKFFLNQNLTIFFIFIFFLSLLTSFFCFIAYFFPTKKSFKLYQIHTITYIHRFSVVLHKILSFFSSIQFIILFIIKLFFSSKYHT